MISGWNIVSTVHPRRKNLLLLQKLYVPFINFSRGAHSSENLAASQKSAHRLMGSVPHNNLLEGPMEKSVRGGRQKLRVALFLKILHT